jgi:copper chaperone CopZ
MRINHLHETMLLLSVSTIAALMVCCVDPFHKPRQAILVVAEMCCEQRAGDAAKELRKVAGVTATRQFVSEGEIQITVNGNAPVLHASLWNAAQKAHVRPVKLIVDGRIIAQHND